MEDVTPLAFVRTLTPQCRLPSSSLEVASLLPFIEKPWSQYAHRLCRILEVVNSLALIETFKPWCRSPSSEYWSLPLCCSHEAMLILFHRNIQTNHTAFLCESLEVTTPLAFVKALNPDATFLHQILEVVMAPQARLRQSLEATFLHWNAATSKMYLALLNLL